MPPPKCPECGRFLATAFVEAIKHTPAPCPRCGTELDLAPDAAPPPAPVVDEPPVVVEPIEVEPDGDLEEVVVLDVAPEPESSVRPPDMEDPADPLAGWDQGSPPAAVVAGHEHDPAVLAAGAGAGLLLGALLGGRDHRALGGLLGAVLGVLLSRLRG